jgi:hypothetical protein
VGRQRAVPPRRVSDRNSRQKERSHVLPQAHRTPRGRRRGHRDRRRCLRHRQRNRQQRLSHHDSSHILDTVRAERGAPSTSKQVGQIPADYSQGSGTIVSGKTANKATEAALVAYPGGVVDRVVKLSNGGYEVHNIGVNWPHHIFVNQSFEVIGAD